MTQSLIFVFDRAQFPFTKVLLIGAERCLKHL